MPDIGKTKLYLHFSCEFIWFFLGQKVQDLVRVVAIASLMLDSLLRLSLPLN